MVTLPLPNVTSKYPQVFEIQFGEEVVADFPGGEAGFRAVRCCRIVGDSRASFLKVLFGYYATQNANQSSVMSRDIMRIAVQCLLLTGVIVMWLQEPKSKSTWTY